MIEFLRILSALFLPLGLLTFYSSLGMTDAKKKATAEQGQIIVAHDVVGGIGGIVLIILAVHIFLYLA